LITVGLVGVMVELMVAVDEETESSATVAPALLLSVLWLWACDAGSDLVWWRWLDSVESEGMRDAGSDLV
jgi:hypothetical protein